MLALLTDTVNTHSNYCMLILYTFPNKPSNKLFPCFYFTAFKAICLVAVCVISSHQDWMNICIITSACQVPSFWPRKLCPTAIKLQDMWQILQISCRIFTWFTHAFLSSFNNNYHQHAY